MLLLKLYGICCLELVSRILSRIKEKRVERQCRSARFLDLLLHKLHACFARFRVSREEVQRYAVVGVHSAKFDNEKDLEAIRNAVLRYNISHPVVNDGDMNLWHELGINSWPTFVLVGPNGTVLAQISGEGRRKDLDKLVEAALQYYGGKKLLNSTSIPPSLEKDNDPRLFSSPLKFPGKPAIDAVNNRLFISDSNHNRIVVTDLDGNFIVQIGSSGEEGFRDGSFDEAAYNRPQGLAYNAKKNPLYVADTENHALREIDFVNDIVKTLAGNGSKGSDYKGRGKGITQARPKKNDFWMHIEMLCLNKIEELQAHI